MGNQAPAASKRTAGSMDIREIISSPSNSITLPLRRTSHRSHGAGLSSVKNALDDNGDVRFWRLLLQQIPYELGVGQRQKFAERRFFAVVRPIITIFEVGCQQDIKFAHASPALPTQFRIGHCALMTPFGEHFLGFSDGFGRVEVFGTRLRAVHDRVTTI